MMAYSAGKWQSKCERKQHKNISNNNITVIQLAPLDQHNLVHLAKMIFSINYQVKYILQSQDFEQHSIGENFFIIQKHLNFII